MHPRFRNLVLCAQIIFTLFGPATAALNPSIVNPMFSRQFLRRQVSSTPFKINPKSIASLAAASAAATTDTKPMDSTLEATSGAAVMKREIEVRLAPCYDFLGAQQKSSWRCSTTELSKQYNGRPARRYRSVHPKKFRAEVSIVVFLSLQCSASKSTLYACSWLSTVG